jgi:hypothetical protein
MSFANEVERLYEVSKFKGWKVNSSDTSVILILNAHDLNESAHIVFTKEPGNGNIVYNSFQIDYNIKDDGVYLGWDREAHINPKSSRIWERRAHFENFFEETRQTNNQLKRLPKYLV